MSTHYQLPGLEAIHFRANLNLFDKLTVLMGKLRLESDRNSSPIIKEVADLIRKETHLNCTLAIRKNNQPNASVVPPMIEKNHPLIEEWLRKHSVANAQGIVASKRNDSTGYVNLKEGRVYGVYSDIHIDIRINSGTFDNSSVAFTDAEIAALLLHEIGHAFGYFEFLGSAVTRNIALIGVVESIFNSKTDIPHRVELLNEAKHKLRLNDLNVEVAAEATDKTKLHLLLVDAEARKLRSELGSDFYDLTSFEFIADQYATRQGAGTALVTGLDKIMRSGGDTVYYNSIRFLIMEVAKTLLFVAVNIFGYGMAAIVSVALGIIMNPLTSTYDTPKDRFKRIRQQLTVELASLHESDDRQRKQAIIDDIALIDRVMADMTTRRTLYQYIFTTFVKSHKNDLKQQQLQKDLEAIGHSDLFIASAKLNLL